MRKLISAMVMLLAAAMPACAQESSEYEAALERYYQRVYGAGYSSEKINQGVEAFRESLKNDQKARDCPAVQAAFDEFADKRFRPAIVAYFQSKAFADGVKSALRQHLTLSDLQAFLAFAESPAGRSYLAHRRDADADVDAAIEGAGQLETLADEMMFVTVRAEAQCRKPQ